MYASEKKKRKEEKCGSDERRKQQLPAPASKSEGRGKERAGRLICSFLDATRGRLKCKVCPPRQLADLGVNEAPMVSL